jgi:sigma-B regulation protein RsbU (phosphoserine phosphatase)
MTDTTQILRQAFKGLEGPDLDILRQMAERRRIPAETVICHEGEIEHEFYIICEGNVVISKRFEDEQDHILAIKGAGEFFGEMALIEDKPRTATVTALVEVELMVITEKIFDQVLARNPIVALSVLRQVSNSLRQADRLTILDQERKNKRLRQAYQELQEAYVALVEKQRLERELEIAAEIQRNILPTRFPDVDGFDFAAWARAARRIGGDFYDIRRVAENKLGLLMADVSGKSIYAAIFMAVARGLFLAEAQHSESPAQVLHGVHDLLMKIASDEGMFVTAFYAIVDIESGRMRYARAGHDHPLHYRQGRISLLPGEGRFLGIFDEWFIDEQELQLLPGDLLVLFSDGITDAVNPSGEQFGVERLRHIVQECAPAGAQVVSDAVLDSVLRFQGTASQFDDMTLQVIAYHKDKLRE